jgi:prevent-host-death family protein
MLRALNLYDAKTHLSTLVEEAAAGAEIIIAKNGRPRAKLVAVRQAAARRPGSGKGKIRMTADFDAPLPKAVLDAFNGGSDEQG